MKFTVWRSHSVTYRKLYGLHQKTIRLVQFSRSVVSDSLWPHGSQHGPQLGLPVHHQLLESTQTHVHWVGDAIQPSHPLSSPSPPSIFPSIRVFSKESALRIRWPKCWSFSFNISPFKEHPELISFRMDCLDLLAPQGTLKSLVQHHSSKAPILWHSAFFIVQLSHPYMTTGKTIALTRQNFVGKVMSLLFNMLSRLVITFLPTSKHLLISWLQSPSVLILEPPQNKVSYYFHCFPIYLPWSDGTRCHDLSFLNVEVLFFPFYLFIFLYFFSFIFISWRLISLQYYSGFWHTLPWISHGFACVPHPDPPSRLPPHRFLPQGWCHLHICGYWSFPGNLDSSLCLLQPSVSHDVLCI